MSSVPRQPHQLPPHNERHSGPCPLDAMAGQPKRRKLRRHKRPSDPPAPTFQHVWALLLRREGGTPGSPLTARPRGDSLKRPQSRTRAQHDYYVIVSWVPAFLADIGMVGWWKPTKPNDAGPLHHASQDCLNSGKNAVAHVGDLFAVYDTIKTLGVCGPTVLASLVPISLLLRNSIQSTVVKEPCCSAYVPLVVA